MTTTMLHEMIARQNRSLFERLVSRVRSNSLRRATRLTLLSMDDHLLRDMGLSRHSVLSDEF